MHKQKQHGPANVQQTTAEQCTQQQRNLFTRRIASRQANSQQHGQATDTHTHTEEPQHDRNNATSSTRATGPDTQPHSSKVTRPKHRTPKHDSTSQANKHYTKAPNSRHRTNEKTKQPKCKAKSTNSCSQLSTRLSCHHGFVALQSCPMQGPHAFIVCLLGVGARRCRGDINLDGPGECSGLNRNQMSAIYFQPK